MGRNIIQFYCMKEWLPSLGTEPHASLGFLKSKQDHTAAWVGVWNVRGMYEGLFHPLLYYFDTFLLTLHTVIQEAT